MLDISRRYLFARTIHSAVLALALGAGLQPQAMAQDGKMGLTLTPPLPGRMTCWFSHDRQQTEAKPLETPKNGSQITLTVPRAYCVPNALVEIEDTERKRIAHLPVTAALDGVAPPVSETNLLFSPVWGVGGMPDADRAVVMAQWRGWLQAGRLARAQRQRFPNGRNSPNLLQNAGFAAGLTSWNMENSLAPAHAEASVLTDAGLPKEAGEKAIRCNITTAGTAAWHLQFEQAGVNLAEGTPYTISFWARADRVRRITVAASLDRPNWGLIGMNQIVNLSSGWKRYSLAFLPFHSQPNHTRISFQVADAAGTVDFADISLRAGVDFPALQSASVPQTALAQNDFQYAPSVRVPIMARGQAAAEGRVTLRNQESAVIGTYDLQASDNGGARFTDVPLNTPLKFTVNAGGKTAEFTRIVAEDKSDTTEAIELPGAWQGIKTAAPAVPSAAAPEEPAAGGGNGLVWIAAGLIAVCAAGLGGYALLARKPKFQETPVISHALVPKQNPLPSSTLNPPLRFPEMPQPTGARLGGKPLPESLPERAGTPAQLMAVAGKYSGSTFALSGSSAVIGRDANCEIPLPLDSSASRRHAEIHLSGDGISITDNHSSNGTFVNGVRLNGETPHLLRPGDEIEIGASRFRYES